MTIHRLLPRVNAVLQKRARFRPSFSPEELDKILYELAKGGSNADMERLQAIRTHSQTLYGVKMSHQRRTAILRGLVDGGHFDRAVSMMCDVVNPLAVNYEQLDMFLTGAEGMPYEWILDVSRRVPVTDGPQLRSKIFRRLVASLHSKYPEGSDVQEMVSAFKELAAEIAQIQGEYIPNISNLLWATFADRGMTDTGRTIINYYRDIFPPEAITSDAEQDCRAKLRHTRIAKGFNAALEMFRDYKASGGRGSSAALEAITLRSTDAEELRIASAEMDIEPNASHWANIMTNCGRKGDIEKIYTLFLEATEAGVPANLTLAMPLLKAFRRKGQYDPLPDETARRALYVYNSLPPQSVDAPATAAVMGILTSAKNSKEFLPIAEKMYNNLKERGVDVSSMTAQVIILRMRGAASEEDAFTIYRSMHQGLDGAGYILVLDAFCRLTIDGSMKVPSHTLYFKIVSDMRVSGHAIMAPVYTILLRQICELASQAKKQAAQRETDVSKEFMNQLVLVTRRTHDILTLDASIGPDSALFTKLMDAYQRLGCFPDACRVWDQMYLSGRYDHVSVSTILDACGYAGAIGIANQTVARLFRSGFEFDKHNWDTWVECLCRLGRLNDAVKAVCIHMGKDQPHIQPDEITVKILLGFARRYGVQNQVLSRLARWRPELAQSLSLPSATGNV